ncbi:MAG: NAD-binding protein [Methylococcaceae bacterium]|nr:NAD-binding protein [Methylococcaceae bacterium]
MNFFYRFINWRRNSKLSFEEDVIKRALIRSALLLLIIIVGHVYLMTLFEAFNWQDALWLTLTTLSTTGYGDISATTAAGKISTVLLLYLGGIFILAKAAGDYFEYRANIRIKKMHGYWEWHMLDHMLVINTPSQQGEQFFLRLIKHLQHSDLQSCTVQILTTQFPNGLPNRLSKMSGLVHYTGSGTNPDDLVAVNAQQAKYIVILAKQEDNRDSDSRTFDILHRLQELKLRPDTLILAESVDDANRQRFRLAGANVIIRPMRAYPEMLIRGLVAPGSEQIIENLFSSFGDLYLRFEVNINGILWKDIVCQLIQQDFGTAVAYLHADTGLCDTNPHANTRITTNSLFVIANDDNPPTTQSIQQALANIRN